MTTPDTPSSKLPRMLALSFAMLILMLVLAALDQTIVSTALPSIARELQGTARLSWVFSAYLIASTVAVPLYGRLADLHGNRPVLLVAVALFLLGSLLCGLSREMDELILARGLQGAGGGGLLTLAMTSVMRLFPRETAPRLQGLLGASYGLSTMAGPLVGGFIVQHFSWRWAFFINLPAGLLALAVLALNFPRQAEPREGTLDLAGAALLSAALVGLLLGTRHPETAAAAAAWPGIAFLVIGGLLSVAFVVVQARVAHPLLPLSMFRRPAFVGASLLSAGSGLALFSAVVFMPIYFQALRGLAPAAAGWHVMPLMAGITLGSIASGRWLSATRRVRPVALAGCGLGALMFIALGFGVRGSGAELGWLAAGLLPLGMAIGVLFPLVTVVVQVSVPPALLGIATASPVMFRSVAGAMGLSAMFALLEHQRAAQAAFGDALSAVLWTAAAMMALSLLAALALPAELTPPAAAQSTPAGRPSATE